MYPFTRFYGIISPKTVTVILGKVNMHVKPYLIVILGKVKINLSLCSFSKTP